MLKNYFKVAWRNLLRHKAYTAINILGLATGIASCILIFLYIENELSFDRHFSKSDRTFRVVNDLYVEDELERAAITGFPLGHYLKTDYPEVEEIARVLPTGKVNFWHEDKLVSEDKIFYAEDTFFSLFDFEMLAGEAATALKEPYSLVLTEEMATKHFGSPEGAMGQLLKTLRNSYTVSGVVRTDKPTHLVFNMLISLSSYPPERREEMLTSWGNTNTYTYLLLQDGRQHEALQAKMGEFYERNRRPSVATEGLRPQSRPSAEYIIQPVADVHFTQDYGYELSPAGNPSYLYIFGFVAAFILLIACINYMNLATARSAKRAREVGLRKVVGAHRWQLMTQFITEAILLTLLGSLLALAFVEMLLPYFSSLTERVMEVPYLSSPAFLLTLLGIILFVGLAASSYPALFLSGFRPVDVLKSEKSPRGSNAILRKGLVVVQFSISLILIIGTIIVFSQMNYLKNSDLGFDKEQVVVMRIPSSDTTVVNKFPAIRQDFLNHPSISKVATAAQIPGEETGIIIFNVEGNNGLQQKSMNTVWVNHDYLDLMNIEMAAGRDFSREMSTDLEEAFIVNEAAVRALGLNDPVGRQMGYAGGENEYGGKIIGVVKDFNYASLHHDIQPLVIRLTSGTGRFLLARMAGDNLPGTIGYLESRWQEFAPRYPLEYFFLDEHFDKQYRAEEKMLTIFGYFTGLTILIACLGLFGLASFMAEQRTKEIGIRKVLGGSVGNIIVLLTKDFAWLVLIAVVVASPIAWFGMRYWLQDFAYRTPIHWWIFAVAGFGALLIAVLTVAYQALKAALLNPVKALRAE
jgi:putative ABC transport system permease protein